MIKIASKLMDTVKDFVAKNPAAVTGLLAGGGIGAIGAALSTGDDPDDPEDTKTRTSRRLRNAIIGAAVGSAAGGGLGYALGENGPLRSPLPEDDVAPEVAAFRSMPARTVMGGIGFGAGTGFDTKTIGTKAKDVLEELNTKLTASGRAKVNLETLKGIARNPDKYKRFVTTLAQGRDSLQPKELLAKLDSIGVKPSYEALQKIDKSMFPEVFKKDVWSNLHNPFHKDLWNAAGKSDFWKFHGERLLRDMSRNKAGLIGAGVGVMAPNILSTLGWTAENGTDLFDPLH